MGRTRRHATASRTQPEQAAVRRRNADRAAAVGGTGRRHDASGDGRRSATGRAARRAIELPGIARRAPQAAFGAALQRQLRQRGLAEADQPGALKTLHDFRGNVRAPVLQHAGSGAGRNAFHMLGNVLQQERYAGIRPAQRPRRARPGSVDHRRAERVDLRVDRFQPGQRGVQHVAGADLATGDQRGKAGGVVLQVFLEHGSGSGSGAENGVGGIVGRSRRGTPVTGR